MLADRSTQLMQTVLDGTATRAETDELDALIARDPLAARDFAAWSAMFRGLSALPASHPPEGLVASICAALPDAERATDGLDEIFAGPDQLSPGPSVIGSGNAQTTRRPFGFQSILWREQAPTTPGRYYPMNANKKFLAGGAAVLAVGIVTILLVYPPKSQDVVGTVVPAERYRAPQSGAEAVKLGEQTGASSSTGGDVATQAAAGNAEAAARADNANAQMKADHVSAQLNADRADAQVKADMINAQMKADKADAQMKADKADAQVKADMINAQMKADKADAQMKADKADAQVKADMINAQMKADKADAQMKADKANAQVKADMINAQMKADKTNAQMKADKADAQMKAEHASAAARAEKAGTAD